MFEHVVRVVGEQERDVRSTRGRALQRLAVRLPVHLEVLLADDDEDGNRRQSQQGGCVRDPELACEGQVGRRLQRLQEEPDALGEGWIRVDGLAGEEPGDGRVVEGEKRLTVRYPRGLGRELGSRNDAHGAAGWTGEDETGQGTVWVLQLVLQGVEGAL